MKLNDRAAQICDAAVGRAVELRIRVATGLPSRVIDCGIEVPGGLAAGCLLSDVCLSGLSEIELSSAGDRSGIAPLQVSVRTDHPVAACMASQYAGWQISGEGFFGMGSGPMRAAAGKEALFDEIGLRETPDVAVGVLETAVLPSAAVCEQIAEACGIAPASLTLLVAPTSSLAGTVQVVARSLETALHKMHEIGFDLQQVISGHGVAPLPPPAANDLEAIGRTNDAVLYGGQVTLWVEADDQQLRQAGPRIPSCSSPDHGRPFAEIFERYERDFYKIDPLLFSPARIRLINLRSGRSFVFGQTEPDVLRQSFEGGQAE